MTNNYMDSAIKAGLSSYGATEKGKEVLTETIKSMLTEDGKVLYNNMKFSLMDGIQLISKLPSTKYYFNNYSSSADPQQTPAKEQTKFDKWLAKAPFQKWTVEQKTALYREDNELYYKLRDDKEGSYGY